MNYDLDAEAAEFQKRREKEQNDKARSAPPPNWKHPEVKDGANAITSHEQHK